MQSNNSQAFGFQTNSNMSAEKQGSLKSKLIMLEGLIQQIAVEVEEHKKECQVLNVERSELEKVLID